jgi:hypothetical protein
MNNIFDFFPQELPPELTQNILKAHKAKITPKAISTFLNIPLREVTRIISQEEKKEEDLTHFIAILTYKSEEISE